MDQLAHVAANDQQPGINGEYITIRGTEVWKAAPVNVITGVRVNGVDFLKSGLFEWLADVPLSVDKPGVLFTDDILEDMDGMPYPDSSSAVAFELVVRGDKGDTTMSMGDLCAADCTSDEGSSADFVEGFACFKYHETDVFLELIYPKVGMPGYVCRIKLA